MQTTRTPRGFGLAQWQDANGQMCQAQESSAVDPSLPDAPHRPGSSFLWLGVAERRMHLSRAQVAALIPHLQAWLATGKVGG